ncbi:hypothetical protein EW093_13045 [Thiospirochaeta perfilievii]|uniref:Uncharacterized protein n=1 Tax=Thiospirochaeta perfilievii TaxID=252967 RepID=A0A5C1QEU8_9SPIO|nr:hypothetical protein [Thiospirochaeta perfilievii]QEN05600.1 hypothetical protein EW093_13045 [Thiospirochaeta perfilievii]
MEKPNGYPSISKDNGEGITFGSFQALGSLKIPFIFCDHSYKLSDMDRNSFTKIDTINILVSVASNLPSDISRILLGEFESYWYSYPKEKYGHDSYYAFIRKLIIRVSFSGLQTELFRKNNPNLLVANKLLGSNVHKQNLRKFALIWLKKEENRYKLVQDSFERLGYKSLEKACEDAGGYSNVKEPSIIEINYIKVLEKLTIDLFKDLFNKNSFHSALSTYLHELCHMFGGDKSAKFSLVLTKAIEILIANNHKINNYKKDWVAVGLKHDK